MVKSFKEYLSEVNMKGLKTLHAVGTHVKLNNPRDPDHGMHGTVIGHKVDSKDGPAELVHKVKMKNGETQSHFGHSLIRLHKTKGV